MPLIFPKYSFGRGIAAPLPINTLKQNLWGGRGAGTPAPQLRLRRKNIGAFTLRRKRLNFAASKNKNQEFQKRTSV